MSENFWQDAARRPGYGWMDRGRANTARFNAAHQPAPPDVTDPEPVDFLMGMSMDEYAAQSNSVPVANDFGLVKENTSGFADAKDLMQFAAEHRADINPYRVHERPGFAPRERGIPAANLPETSGGIRYRGTETI